MNRFKECLEVILVHEGGYVDHPRDPGGKTNLGITAKTLAEWRNMSIDTITETAMRALTIDDVAPIYEENYWNKVLGNRLPAGVDLSMFDMAVNAGHPRAIKMMQAILPECKVDGLLGPITLGKIREEYDADPIDLISDYAYERERFYRSLHHFDTFGRGWLRRVGETKLESINMIE